MRVWHQKLIPLLCQKHLCAMWREGLGAYKIITENKNGYRNHPAVKEFENAPIQLYNRLRAVRQEMLARGYHPKEMPKLLPSGRKNERVYQWQTLEEQIKVLKTKNCKCQIM